MRVPLPMSPTTISLTEGTPVGGVTSVHSSVPSNFASVASPVASVWNPPQTYSSVPSRANRTNSGVTVDVSMFVKTSVHASATQSHRWMLLVWASMILSLPSESVPSAIMQ